MRAIAVTSSLAEYLGPDWPGCAWVFRRSRVRRAGPKVETEVVLRLTSVLRERAGALAGLKGIGGHGSIENGLHGGRDGTHREDARRIRRGSASEGRAALRNLIGVVFKRRGHTNAAAATRHDVCRPGKALEVLSSPS